MSLHKIRRGGAILFEVISILIIVFYSSPELFGKYHSSTTNQTFFQADSRNPIVYYKASENLSFNNPLPKIQIAEHPNWDITFDMPAVKVTTNKALFVVAYLRNMFYVFVSINAP